MSERFGDVALIGLGASTQAAATYLLTLPAGEVGSVSLYAGPSSIAARERAAALEAQGARVVFDTEELAGSYDLCIASPGIPCGSAFYTSAAAHSAEVLSEPELAWRESPHAWAAITGTNGKTTTTTLACELLRAGGVPARTVGNIGLPPIACVTDRAESEVFVAELSSFQLHGCTRFAPRVAVLLNVTPDHLEWHGSLEAYAADKERAFANLGPRDLAVVGTDEACRVVAARCRARGVRTVVLGEEPCPCACDAAWLDGATGRLVVRLNGRDRALCAWDAMHLKGPHNLQNALAAATLALEMGASDEGVAAGLLDFAPLAHRVEPCGQVAGVAYFDDSKGTNTDAVLKALASFEPGRVVLLVGGHDKGTDLSAFSREVVAGAKAVVAYGEAGPRFFAALSQAASQLAAEGLPCARVEQAAHMREAFDTARALATCGDVVLLSPACSSFDEFSGYKERGAVFQGWVAQLAEGADLADANADADSEDAR